MFELRTVDSVEKFDGQAEMFDLTVDQEGTYVANGVAVHNTEICRSLDGRQWKKEDEEWSAFVPPLHHNCRSVLVPVFAGVEPDEWDQPPDGLEPAEGFGGSVGSRVRPAGSVKHPGYQ